MNWIRHAFSILRTSIDKLFLEDGTLETQIYNYGHIKGIHPSEPMRGMDLKYHQIKDWMWIQ